MKCEGKKGFLHAYHPVYKYITDNVKDFKEKLLVCKMN